MPKRLVAESRFDFRGGRNTAVSADLLNASEFADTTNVRLIEPYGAFTKRTGTQRIHSGAFPAPIRGVTQWDTLSGKQVVVISNGDLYYRNGFDYNTAFTKAVTTGTARTTATNSPTAGWLDPDGVDDGINALTVAVPGSPGSNSSTVAAGNRLIEKVGDPTVDSNLPAADDLYTISFKITANGTGMVGSNLSVDARIQLEYSTNDGGVYTPIDGVWDVSAGPGTINSTTFSPVLLIDIPASKLWIRLILTVTVSTTSSGGSGSGSGNVKCYETVYQSVNFPTTWTTGVAKFSLTEPAIFAPFRKSAAGAPLVLYVASGGHYFSWTSSNTLTQLDPTNAAPQATSIISYHTRMFSMMASSTTPGLLPKTIAWSKIGDPENFTVTGLKSEGGAAVTDFLTGQQLTALEVIGSSLLMATVDSVMRFTGQSSDDIVIAQNTEGIAADVGAVGLLALKRFENAAGMLAARGPYAVTEVAAVPLGEKVLPDFDALDSANLPKSVVIYNRGRKELLFIVPGGGDAGLNKTIYAYSSRLQTWYGPWAYSFGISCASTYAGASDIENVLVGCSDGFVRLLDVGTLDDVLYNGSGGAAITMTAELALGKFKVPAGTTVALNRMALQATLPTASALQLKTSFDGDSETTDSIASLSVLERNYRQDLDGQGKRLRMRFVDASVAAPIVHGFNIEAYVYGRP